MRKLKVAAVQVRCEPLRSVDNLAHSEAFIEQAAGEGAELVLLPELMPGGYVLTERQLLTLRSRRLPSSRASLRSPNTDRVSRCL